MNKTKPDQTQPKKPNSSNLVKKKKGQKLQLDSDRGALNVGLIMEMPLKTELWKLKIPKICFQFL